MSKTGRPAFVEDMEGDSEENRTVRNSRQSASIRKKERRDREDRPRREKKSHSDDGNSIRVPKDDDEVTTIDKIRVIPDPRERDHRDSRRRSNASTPSGRGHRKSHSRPATTNRGVTFDTHDSSRPSKDDPRYFGRRGGEDTVEQPSRRSRPPLTMPSHTAPARPTSFHAHARPPLSASAAFQPPHVIYPAAVPVVAASPIAGSMYSGYSGYFQQPSSVISSSPRHGGMAERFMRTGNFPTTRPMSDAGYYDEPRQIGYYEDEDDYDSEEEREQEGIRQEEEREAAREAEQKKREKELRRKERALKEREEKLRNEELDRLRQEKRDRDSMPPPSMPRPDNMRRRLSMRSKPPPSVDSYPGDYPTFEDAREMPMRRRALENRRQSRDNFMPGSYTHDDEEVTIPMRPRITYRDTEPAAPPQRRQSMSRAPASATSFDFSKGTPNIRVEGRGRRASVYEPASAVSSASSNWEDKEAAAMGYQKDISGEPPKLTADLLRKQQHTIASCQSRSTRSSASRDESDVRQSVTTRTTRSGSAAETDELQPQNGGEYTIQIKGRTTLDIPGGGTLTTEGEPVELTIRGHPGGAAAAQEKQLKRLGNGSEASRSEYAPSAPSVVSAVEERERRRRGVRHSYQGASASDTMASMRPSRYGMPGEYGEPGYF